MSFTYETDIPPEELLVKASKHLKAVGFEVKTRGHILEAVNGRDYSVGWAIFTLVISIILLFMLLGPLLPAIWWLGPLTPLALPLAFLPFLVYWFSRKKNRLTLDVSIEGRFTITYDGVRALREAERLVNMFKK